MVVKWSKTAKRDLEAVIASHIAKDHADAAQGLMHVIRARTEALTKFPLLGCPGDQTDTLDILVHKHYRVTYRIRADDIEILQVWHTALEQG